MNDYDEAVLLTFSLLESRLARLEYLLSGPIPTSHTPAPLPTSHTPAPLPTSHSPAPLPVPARITAIEASLTRLAGRTALLDNANELLSKHKHLLHPTPPPPSTPLTPAQKSHLVLDKATTISTTASQLSSLADTHIPDTHGFALLAALRPRIAEAKQKQLQQALKISELRRRSGLLVQRDKQVLGVAGGSAWMGCQERLVRGGRGVLGVERRREEGEDKTAKMVE